VLEQGHKKIPPGWSECLSGRRLMRDGVLALSTCGSSVPY
jgi:hypothetical protein